MKLFSVICISILTALTSHGAVKRFTSILPNDSVSIPVDISSGHITVQTMINEQGPVQLQLDTYASYDLCLDGDLAKTLTLKTTGTASNSNGQTWKTHNRIS